MRWKWICIWELNKTCSPMYLCSWVKTSLRVVVWYKQIRWKLGIWSSLDIKLLCLGVRSLNFLTFKLSSSLLVIICMHIIIFVVRGSSIFIIFLFASLYCSPFFAFASVLAWLLLLLAFLFPLFFPRNFD